MFELMFHAFVHSGGGRQVAVTTGISFACANFIATVATLKTSFEPEPKHVIGIYAAVLITQGECSVLSS